ncbi:MAG: carboxypeptidase regulatory-like domain-containing protein [Deltaproteobacteria bacterium]|nr:carboxypeptidase regulatory-like domain-containing protein [Deltaproteobacteria bacterium]
MITSLADLIKKGDHRRANHQWRIFLVLLGLVALLALGVGACGGEDGGGEDGGGEDAGIETNGSILGRLAASANRQSARGLSWLLVPPDFGTIEQGLSLDEVSVELLLRDGDSSPDSWPVEQTATPDSTGAFAFVNLAEGDYALKVNQPEFAELAYGVDSTDFHLEPNQTVNLVLPLVTTILHGLMDPSDQLNPYANTPPAYALDPATGEILLTSNQGFAVIDPERGKLDLLFSQNFFIGRHSSFMPPDRVVLALAPGAQTVWILYSDRLLRIDRSLFTNPDESEVINLDDLSSRMALGDKFRFRMLAPLTFNPQQPDGAEAKWTGQVFFSPDGKFLYASSWFNGVLVIDTERMEIVRVILGQAIGYNPVSNFLFFTNGQYGFDPGSEIDGTEILVVDASTYMEVNSAPIAKVMGVAAVPNQPETILIRVQQSTEDLMIPFVVVVDEGGAVQTDQRARDYLGIDADPEIGAPSFNLAGDYFMIGSAAFRVLEDGGFEPVPVAIPAGQSFNDRMQCNQLRAVDPANLYELWYGCRDNNTVGLLSLDQTNVPVAVRPSVPITDVLLDRTRGRAIFGGFDRLVLIHYADPSAAGQDELTDLSSVMAPFMQEGAACSAANPCAGTDLCAGATDTSFTGQCTPNSRLPYLPFCGGFTQAACDEDFTCTLANPTNPNSAGECTDLPSRDYAAHGPVCDAALPCPAGMLCGATNRCEPKPCLRDLDCAAYPGEICGLVANLGRVCLTPGPLLDNAPCLNSGECLHGACIAIAGAYNLGDSELLHGARGLQVCSRPCYQNADCPDEVQCIFIGMWDHSIDEAAVWYDHHRSLVPHCRPSVLPPLEGCEGCTGEQLCERQGCQIGFSPEVWVNDEQGTHNACLLPAENCGEGPCSEFCEYPCVVSGDCPFLADCVSGLCSGRPCERTCAADQSCMWFSVEEGICVTGDSCVDDGDCGGSQSLCIYGICTEPSGPCVVGSDCNVGEECVEYMAIRECAVAMCGCAGPLAGDMVCDAALLRCVIPGLCTDVPCDGSVVAECVVTPPEPLPDECLCPNCPWDDLCAGGATAAICPAGFTCPYGPMPEPVGQACVCNSLDCQTP